MPHVNFSMHSVHSSQLFVVLEVRSIRIDPIVLGLHVFLSILSLHFPQRLQSLIFIGIILILELLLFCCILP
jgi:hypothetical protein